MATYTVIGFEKDGFNSFTSTVSAQEPTEAARRALQDVFIKRAGRRPPNAEALAHLENQTGLFVVGIVEGEHDNLDADIDHYEQW